MMSLLSVPVPTTSVYLPAFPISSRKLPDKRSLKLNQHGLAVPDTSSWPFQHRRAISFARRIPSTARIVCTALNASCSAVQTKTVQHKSPTNATLTPKDNTSKGSFKMQKIDIGGFGFPPRGGGGGGGGGGGYNWSGGFYFFAFLVFLDYLKEEESKSQRERE